MKIFEKLYEDEGENTLEYVWVFVIVFFLVLFLSQAFVVWIFGEISSGLVWMLLLLLSLALSYFLLFGNGHTTVMRVLARINDMRDKREMRRKVKLRNVPETEDFSSRPDEEESEGEGADEIKKLEHEAHDEGALISSEGLNYIAEFGDKKSEVLKSVIEEGRKTYPRFDGWLVLNKHQILSILGQDVIEGSQEHEGALHHSIPDNLPIGTLQHPDGGATATFVSLLCKGDEKELFTFVRTMRAGGDGSLREFIQEAILLLDQVHEHRMDGIGYVDKEVLENTQCFSNDELEHIIAILSSSVDYRYTRPELGIKTALLRALTYIRKNRSD